MKKNNVIDLSFSCLKIKKLTEDVWDLWQDNVKGVSVQFLN
jgi:hypothetical protein